MKGTVGVALGNSGRRIGVLRYNRDGARESASFEYDAEWLAAPDRFRIDPALAHGRLVSSDGIPVALVRRFDRVDSERLMYFSAATLMGATAGGHTEHTYAEMVDTIRVYGAAPEEDIEDLWRRIGFSILITNVDDHLHNHGFLHVERETWRLAPAFDINPFPDKLRELKTWVSEETGPAASVEALMSAVPYFGLKLDRARQVLGEVEYAVAQWRTRGAEFGMTEVELGEFVDAFEHDERLAAQSESAHVST